MCYNRSIPTFTNGSDVGFMMDNMEMEISVVISDETLGYSTDEDIACYLSAVQSAIEREYPHASVSVERNRDNWPNIVDIRNCPAHLDEDTVCHRVEAISDYVWEKSDLWDPSMK